MKRSKLLLSEAELGSCKLMDEADECIGTASDANDGPSTMIGDVLEGSTDLPGRALVRWRTLNGNLHEQSLSVVKGLNLRSGDLVLLQRPGNWPEFLVTNVIQRATEPSTLDAAAEKGTAETKLDVKMDGKRIEIEGQDEVILRCGQASITLRRNGRVVVRGTYVESKSKGTNRIKGGVVLIN